MFRNIPSVGAADWQASVNNPVDLPIAGSLNGDIRLVLNTNELYRYNSTLVSWVLISSGGGGTGQYTVQRIVLSPTDISNKFVLLAGTPLFPAMTKIEVISGPLQDYSTDYSVSGNTVSWSSLGLESILVSTDILYITYI